MTTTPIPYALVMLLLSCVISLQCEASTRVTLEGSALPNSSIQIEYRDAVNVRVAGPQQLVINSFLLLRDNDLYNVMAMSEPAIIMNLSALGAGASSFVADKKIESILSATLIGNKRTGITETIAGIAGEQFELTYQSKRGSRTIQLVVAGHSEIQAYTRAWMNLTKKRFSISGEKSSGETVWSFLEQNNYGILKLGNLLQVASIETNLAENGRLSLPGDAMEPLKGSSVAELANKPAANPRADGFDAAIARAEQSAQNMPGFQEVLRQYVGSDEEIAQNIEQTKARRLETIQDKDTHDEIKAERERAAANSQKVENVIFRLFPEREFSMMSYLEAHGHNNTIKNTLQINHKPGMTRFVEPDSSYNPFYIFRADKNIAWTMIPASRIHPGIDIYWRIDLKNGKGLDGHIDSIISAYEETQDIAELTLVGNENLQGIATRHYSREWRIPWEESEFNYYDYWVDADSFIRKATIRTPESSSTLTFYQIRLGTQATENFAPPINYLLADDNFSYEEEKKRREGLGN